MRNLHQFYYKDYFSKNIKGVDKENDSLSFSYIIKEEEKDRVSNPDEKKRIGNEISTIKTNNKAITEKRNGILIGSGCSLKEDNKYILREETFIPHITESKELEGRGFYDIPLRISYPGLVTGIGIDHEAKIEGEFKLGVHFDWTYGMPVIYGSSVKGVLRSALIAKTEKGKIVEYDDYFLKQATGRNWSQEEMDILFNDIFNGKKFVKEVEDDGKKIREYQNKSIYERDIFFDAVITAPDKDGHILCSDSITPHGDNPLKNPTPLTFLKIAPGCKLEFRFKLEDTKDLSGKVVFAKEDKRILFTKVLTTLGIGAKTNVGYGQLKEVNEVCQKQ